jgi:hypothetical protein
MNRKYILPIYEIKVYLLEYLRYDNISIVAFYSTLQWPQLSDTYYSQALRFEVRDSVQSLLTTACLSSNAYWLTIVIRRLI